MVTDPHAPPFTLAIIGGGLAGLSLSIGLTRYGIPHKIYESAKCFSQIGAGIAMGPNAVWALKLIDPRLRECYDRCATYNEREDQQDVFLNCRYGMESDKTGAVKYVVYGQGPLQVLTRTDSEISFPLSIVTTTIELKREEAVSIGLDSWTR